MTVSGGADRGPPRASAVVVAARATTTWEHVRGAAALLQRRPHSPIASAPGWRRLGICAAVIAGAVALSMMFLDDAAFVFVSGLPPWLVDLFYEITDFGRSGSILIPVGGLIVLLALIAAASPDRAARAMLATLVVRLGYIFVAVGLPGLVNTIVKRWIGRERPSLHGPFVYQPFSWRPEFASFPSGHVTTAFAALVAIGVLYPRARPLLWAYALLIAASRVVVAAHYPSDVIAGAATGAFGALCVRQWFASRRLVFRVGADGGVHPKPSPSRRRVGKLARAVLAG